MSPDQNPFSKSNYYGSSPFRTDFARAIEDRVTALDNRVTNAWNDRPSWMHNPFHHRNLGTATSGHPRQTPGGTGINKWMDNLSGSAKPSWSTVATSSFSTTYASFVNPWATPNTSYRKRN